MKITSQALDKNCVHKSKIDRSGKKKCFIHMCIIRIKVEK